MKTLPRKQVSEIAQSIIDAIAVDSKITRRALAAQLGFPEIPSFQLVIFTEKIVLQTGVFYEFALLSAVNGPPAATRKQESSRSDRRLLKGCRVRGL